MVIVGHIAKQRRMFENRPKIETWRCQSRHKHCVALEYNKECILYLEPSRSGMNYERKSAKEAITKTH